MKKIVITGSTRGIGLGMARVFLARGCYVAVCSSQPHHVAAALDALSTDFDPERIFGRVCDVTQGDDLEALYDLAEEKWGGVDIWINNAGISQSHQAFHELDPEEITQLTAVNLAGVMLGTRTALDRMLSQGHGMIFNMEGLGSDGRLQSPMALYGASKRGVRYFTRSLVRDYQDSPVKIGFLSPGMVLTDLLTGRGRTLDDIPERSRRIFNILADQVETVAPFLVDKILDDPEHGARIAWLTTGKIMWRFLTAPFSKRHLFGG
jgi:NAD(P)-dependent dehydrogenase (short-subunit alcohol dehydrogenase family)